MTTNYYLNLFAIKIWLRKLKITFVTAAPPCLMAQERKHLGMVPSKFIQQLDVSTKNNEINEAFGRMPSSLLLMH